MLHRNPDLIVETVDGELIVLDRNNEQVHKLNDTAAAIFEMCDGTMSKEDIKKQFCSQYDVEPDQVDADISQALESFVALGLLMDGPG